MGIMVNEVWDQQLAVKGLFHVSPFNSLFRFLSGFFTPQPESGLRSIVVACHAGGRAGVTSHLYRSPGLSSYGIAVKIGGDESWGRISEDFIHRRRGSLIKRLTS